MMGEIHLRANWLLVWIGEPDKVSQRSGESSGVLQSQFRAKYLSLNNLATPGKFARVRSLYDTICATTPHWHQKEVLERQEAQDAVILDYLARKADPGDADPRQGVRLLAMMPRETSAFLHPNYTEEIADNFVKAIYCIIGWMPHPTKNIEVSIVKNTNGKKRETGLKIQIQNEIYRPLTDGPRLGQKSLHGPLNIVPKITKARHASILNLEIRCAILSVPEIKASPGLLPPPTIVSENIDLNPTGKMESI
ncbi:hypothetical protein GQX73_g2 [Xylaria multiplex]|uniref:Uncharacterized protein n=1 Tax=Xylaria multiplex TaxID=323545 RepID=A0A7C8IVK3_9PEZI|nr:hypothetical protein GQX73_g2 [Xylaria multiplex]